jgi:small subunit ribosomal protein S7
MSRKKSFANELKVGLDPVYKNPHLFKFINRLMESGKKAVAEKIVYGAFDIVRKETNQDPLTTFIAALENIRPLVEVRSRRIGGATYQIPVDVRSIRSYSLGIRWFVEESRKRKEKTMMNRLASEIIAASKFEGATFKKKENMMKMVEANRAFSHLKF